MARIGRIGGAVLQPNLVRNGVDLAFKNTASDTSLLFLDVNNNRLGINKDVAGVTLHIDGEIKSTNLISQSWTNGDIEISGSEITKLTSGPLYINATANYEGLATDQIEFDTNFIRTTESNANLELRANASGEVVFEDTVTVQGSLFSPNDVNVVDLSVIEVTSSNSTIGNFTIDTNIITNTLANADLYLRANGSGNIVVDTSLNSPSVVVYGNLTSDSANIENFTAYINNTDTITASQSITTKDLSVATSFSASDVDITQNTIKTTASDLNLNLNSAGTGTIELLKDTNITGSLHATGNITLDGNIILGDDSSQDNLTINADIASSILPSQNEAFDLGSVDRRWVEMESLLLNGQNIESAVLTAGAISLGKRIASTIFVSQNGSDTNYGDHPQAPLRTIKHALDVADSSTAPVQILISPGVYQEQTPLVIPPYCSVTGTDIRNTIIQPESSTIENDVFHMNGESTVENLSIQNFYYNSTNNTGYAFRFAPSTLITTRSPYIRNITVITKGSTQTAADPKGFTYGDAGKGAWIDGSEVNSSSEDASMLFHSCTFITPGVDCITMTNGVRVEWLNSFTYFANRGLYAVDGSPGRVSNDGSTIKFGAEIRSIGSANVYGNYGVEADGTDSLMYLIGHNFAYIGAGAQTTNDPSQAIESQEVIQANNGKVYFHSIDHNGKFKVGDSFFVDLETGDTSFDVSGVTADEFTTITIQDGGNKSVLDYTNVQTGNIVFSGNTVDTVNGSLEITPATEINLENTFIEQDLSVTGNLNFEGTLTLFGDASTDTLKFETEITQNFNPNSDSEFNLGSPTSQWKDIWLSELSTGDITIKDNFITTNISNSDLELRANASGIVIFDNLSANNDTSVSGITNLLETFVTGNITQTSNLELTGNYVSDLFTVDNVRINGKTIDATTGSLVIGSTDSPNSDVSIRSTTTVTNNKNLTVFGNSDLLSTAVSNSHTVIGDASFTGTFDVVGQLSIDGNVLTDRQVEFENIFIDNNFITTLESNSDLEFRANGVGEVNIKYPLLIDQNFENATTVNASEILSSGNVTGVPSAIFQAGDIKIQTNDITTTVSSADLTFRTSNGFDVSFSGGNVLAQQGFNVELVSNLQNTNTTNVTITGDISVQTNVDVTGNITSDDITFVNNVIQTTLSNSDLELISSGSNLSIQDNFSITQDLIIEDDSILQDVVIVGSVTHTGNRNQVGDIGVTNLISNTVQIDSSVKFQEVLVDGNLITTTTGNNDLVFSANGSGTVILDNDLQITNNLSAGSITVNNVVLSNAEIDSLDTGDIIIEDNFITTSVSNSNLELRTAGSGIISLANYNISNSISSQNNGIEINALNKVSFDTNSAVKLPAGTEAEFLSNFGIRYNSVDNLYESKNNTGRVTFNQLFSDDRRTSVIAQESNQIDFTIDTQSVMEIYDTYVRANGIKTQEIDISNNIISTQNTNADIELKARGAGEILIGDIAIVESFIINYNTGAAKFTNVGRGYVKFDNETALVVPTGTTQDRPTTPDIGELRFNSVTKLMEIYDGFDWVLVAGSGAGITEADMEELLLTYTIALG